MEMKPYNYIVLIDMCARLCHDDDKHYISEGYRVYTDGKREQIFRMCNDDVLKCGAWISFAPKRAVERIREDCKKLGWNPDLIRVYFQKGKYARKGEQYTLLKDLTVYNCG